MHSPLGFSDIILTIGTFISFLLLVYLVVTKSNRNRANLFLLVVVLTCNLFVFPRFLHRTGLLELFPHFYGFARVTDSLLGPATYFYVRACTEKEIRWRPIHLLILVPFIIDIVSNLPFFLLSGSEKMEVFYHYQATGDTGQSIVHYIITVFYTAVFFVFAIRHTILYRRHLTETTSSIDRIYHRWLLVFCILCILPFILYAVLAFSGFSVVTMSGMMGGMYIFLFIIFLFALFKPEIFYTFPHPMKQTEMDLSEKKKYEQSSLDEQRKEQYLTTLLQFMDTQKPFQQPDLTINQLSEQVGIPYYYLSQIINEKLNSNFIDFINQYRIEAAKKMLTSEKFEQYTIVAIAYEAGFNSKSAFYSAFKRITNTTPSKFRKQLTIS